MPETPKIQNSEFTIKSTKTGKLYNSFNSSQSNPHSQILLPIHTLYIYTYTVIKTQKKKKSFFFQKFSLIKKKDFEIR